MLAVSFADLQHADLLAFAKSKTRQ